MPARNDLSEHQTKPSRPTGSNRLPEPVRHRRIAEDLGEMDGGFGRNDEFASDHLQQLIAEVRPGQGASDACRNPDDPMTPLWTQYTGWALKVLSDPPAPISRDAGDCLEWLGSGDELEHFESPDLPLLRDALQPHELGRHPADVYGLQARIDRARTCWKLDRRHRMDNHQRAEALERY